MSQFPIFYRFIMVLSRAIILVLFFTATIGILRLFYSNPQLFQQITGFENTGVGRIPLTDLPTNEEIYVNTYPRVVLQTLWQEYATKIQKDGRTIDRDRDYLTTSEGQSYSMLRAVWMSDKDVFDRVLRWTNNNIKVRKNDELFSWMWGKRPNGQWGVITEQNGENTASDADLDIALALIFAYEKWGEDKYLEQAITTLNDIWKVEVIKIKNKPILVAGNWAMNEKTPTVNPSYFSFAAYDIFAKYNPENDWKGLKDSSYEILFAASNNPAKLPPDWVGIDRQTGQVVKVIHEDKTSDFSDDAIRVYWRVALDWEYSQDERAKKYIEEHSGLLIKEWKEKKKIFAAYTPEGTPAKDYESNSLYGTFLPAVSLVDQQVADEIYRYKIASLYDVDNEEFKTDRKIGYYDQNWVWFGIGLYKNMIPDLSKRM